MTWQAVRPFRTQVRDLTNSGSETVLGEKFEIQVGDWINSAIVPLG